jgi:hypothetical protein
MLWMAVKENRDRYEKNAPEYPGADFILNMPVAELFSVVDLTGAFWYRTIYQKKHVASE